MLLLGHRGCRGKVTENTLAAFDHAIECGCDGFEFDVRLSADAIPVVWHDARVGGRSIARHTFVELRERFAGERADVPHIRQLQADGGRSADVSFPNNPLKPTEGLNGPPASNPLKPTEGLNGPPASNPLKPTEGLNGPPASNPLKPTEGLNGPPGNNLKPTEGLNGPPVNGRGREAIALCQLEEVLARYAQVGWMDIELKVRGAEAQVAELLRRYRPERGFVVSSFRRPVLLKLHGIDSSLPLAFIFDRMPQKKTWRELPIQYVKPSARLVTPARVREFHAAGMKVLTWTVNRRSAMRRLWEAGVDGMIGDDPAVLVDSRFQSFAVSKFQS